MLESFDKRDSYIPTGVTSEEWRAFLYPGDEPIATIKRVNETIFQMNPVQGRCSTFSYGTLEELISFLHTNMPVPLPIEEKLERRHREMEQHRKIIPPQKKPQSTLSLAALNDLLKDL